MPVTSMMCVLLVMCDVCRFWSVLLFAVYIYVHQKYIWQFAARFKATFAGLQIGSTLDYFQENLAFNKCVCACVVIAIPARLGCCKLVS